jgi:methionyl-tRNA synthetase
VIFGEFDLADVSAQINDRDPNRVVQPEFRLFDGLLSGFARYQEAFDALEFRRLTSELLGIWRLGNEYFSAAEPWRLVAKER